MDEDHDFDEECDHCEVGTCGIVIDSYEMIPPKHYLLFNTFHFLAAIHRAIASWYVGNAEYIGSRGERAQKKEDADDFAKNLGVFND